MNCDKCHDYFFGYVEDKPHPHMAETGTEGRCALCNDKGSHEKPYQKCDCRVDINESK